MSRVKMSPAERDWRSRLAQMLHRDPLMRGTLSVRKVTCGKPTCRCAKGQKHITLYLTYSQLGKTHQVFIPKDLQEEVRQSVGNYQKVRHLMEQICAVAWEALKNRKG
jgi:hypothetical protein